MPPQVFLLSKNDMYSMISKTSKMCKDLALLIIVIFTFTTEAETDYHAWCPEKGLLINTKLEF